MSFVIRGCLGSLFVTNPIAVKGISKREIITSHVHTNFLTPAILDQHPSIDSEVGKQYTLSVRLVGIVYPPNPSLPQQPQHSLQTGLHLSSHLVYNLCCRLLSFHGQQLVVSISIII